MASTGVLLTTLWNQSGVMSLGSNITVTYNEFCPELSGRSCLTGCTNTAAAQLIYYFIQKKGLKLSLTLTSEDEFSKGSISIYADGSTAGTISFAQVNSYLANYSVDSAIHAAALTYACGVVQEANYGTSATSTSWNEELFTRAGLNSVNHSYIGWEESYFWGKYDDDSGTYYLTDGAWEVLIENLEAGSPVGVSYPGHALVIDGYDRTNDKFHINFGWGNSSATRWYTRSEMIEEKYYQFIYDLTMTPEKNLTVNDSDLYGTGTLLRAFERANAGKGANTIDFDCELKLDDLDLRDYVSLSERTVINNFNMSVRFTDNIRSSWGMGLRGEEESVTTFNDFTGEVIANTGMSSNAPLFLCRDSLTTVKMHGALLYGGSYDAGVSYDYGSDAVSRSAQSIRLGQAEISSSIINSSYRSVYAYEAEKLTLRMDEASVAIGDIYASNCPENTIGIYNNSRLYGNVSTGSGNDSIYVYNGSLLQGNLSLGSGTNTLIVDSSSRVDGIIYSSTDLTFKLKSGYKSDALFTIQSNAYNLYNYAKSITVDFSAAAAGTYTLFAGTSAVSSISILQSLQLDLVGKNSSFSLSVNGTSFNDFASVYYENYSLKVDISGTLDNVAPSVCSGFTYELRDRDVLLNWNDASDNVGIANYMYRCGSSSYLTGEGNWTAKSEALIRNLENGTYYYQVRSVDKAGNMSGWSSVQSFTVTDPAPDIVIASYTQSNTAIYSNKSVKLTFTVRNAGYRDAGASRVGIYAGKTRIGTVSVSALAAGAEKTFTFTAAGKLFAYGSNTITLISDVSSQVSETREDNNRASGQLKVVNYAPNLLLKNVKASASDILSNQAVKLTFNVGNNGYSAAGATTAYIYDGSKVLGKVAIGAIAKRTWDSKTYSFTIAAGKLAAGTHNLKVVLDAAKAVAESNESDNTSSAIPVKATRAVFNLVQKNFKASSTSVLTNQALKLTFNVGNNGNISVKASTAYIYDGTKVLGKVAIGAIAGRTWAPTYSYTIAAGKLAAGTHNLKVVLDGNNALAEGKENDNASDVISVKVTAAPNLLMKNLKISSTKITESQAVKLAFTVGNNGYAAAKASTAYIYDGTKVLGKVAIGAIAKRTWDSTTYSYTISAGKLAAGTHKLKVVLDAAKAVAESNESDNTGSVDLLVTPAVAPALSSWQEDRPAPAGSLDLLPDLDMDWLALDQSTARLSAGELISGDMLEDKNKGILA